MFNIYFGRDVIEQMSNVNTSILVIQSIKIFVSPARKPSSKDVM